MNSVTQAFRTVAYNEMSKPFYEMRQNPDFENYARKVFGKVPQIDETIAKMIDNLQWVTAIWLCSFTIPEDEQVDSESLFIELFCKSLGKMLMDDLKASEE